MSPPLSTCRPASSPTAPIVDIVPAQHARAPLALACFVASALVGSLGSGCSANIEDKKGDGATAMNLRDPGRDGNDPVWIYGGPLPQLTNVRIVVSTRGHTARITGFAPTGWSGTLPPHAIADVIGGRKRITVVYPIATVDNSYVRADGTNARNADKGSYTNIRVYPYTPYGVGSEENRNTPWGGFPYIEYDRNRSIAFHGPITRPGGIWQLMRGPVSHACNRMQGEHVVELAHLMGVNMNKVWRQSDFQDVNIEVKVLGHNEFDKVEDGSLAGKFVDVAYPTTAGAEGVSKGSPISSHVFTTWNGMDKPEWVCMSDAAKVGSANPCGGGGVAGGGSTGRPDVARDSSTLKPNSFACNVDEFANVRNDALSSVIGRVAKGERFHAYAGVPTRTDTNGVVFRYAFFFANEATGEPAGAGWIWEQKICKL